AARVGEHADELREKPELGQRVKLHFHTFLLIEEPPAGAELDLARSGAVLEVADHRTENVVVGWIEVIEDDLGQLVVAVECVEVTRKSARLRKVSDRVHPGVGPNAFEQAAVVVAQGSEVELL